MLIIELSCAAIVTLYLVVTLRDSPQPGSDAALLGLLAVAAWLGENTVIHAYGFYAYSPAWSVFVDRVPLMVLLIWPVVIHSAWVMLCQLQPRSARWLPLAGALLVLTDASMIEPIAVQAGLWWWTHPGLFDVPLVGLLGWSFFAGLCMLVMQHAEKLKGRLLILLVAPLGTHVLLLASWWGLLRWIEGPVPPWPAVALVWLISAALVVALLRWRPWRRVDLTSLLLRAPAAGFFFVLLALYGRDQIALVAYALAFAPPYLLLTPWRALLRSQISNSPPRLT